MLVIQAPYSHSSFPPGLTVLPVTQLSAPRQSPETVIAFSEQGLPRHRSDRLRGILLPAHFFNTTLNLHSPPADRRMSCRLLFPLQSGCLGSFRRLFSDSLPSNQTRTLIKPNFQRLPLM
ncbi:hypothetical protein TNCT_668211 [Trichonephila clavata]|uniref:Uncharacterized protein n=1 Tax=Trichonephila clavata TaxID=2740835 RepID=A0A8X6FXS6_TRICU|nr:hypothetical protein TNCT_668211 [Trichonephila clavata]